MKYLRTVILKNFQSHKYSIIDFNQGLNVIVGPSDTGKSAIIRGIKWALYNEPAGDYFIREGEKECSVTLEFSDNTKITRLRSSSKNSYILNKNNGEEIKFEGFGTSVPQEIIDEVGISKILLDSSESTYINLGEQLEGPFLLSEKTSTRASAIGRLIGVNIIDDALKDTLRDLRNINVKKKHFEEMTSKIEDELKSYAYLEELSKQIYKIERTRDLIKENSIKLETLKRLFQDIRENSSSLKQTNITLERLKDIHCLESIIKDILILDKDYRYFVTKKKNLDGLKDEIAENIDFLNKIENITRLEPIYNDIKSMQERRAYLLQIADRLYSNTKQLNILINIEEQLKELPRIKDIIESLEYNINKIVELINLYKGLSSVQRSIAVGNAYMEKLEDIDKVENIYNSLENSLKNLRIFQDYYRNWVKLNMNLEKEVNDMDSIENKIDLELNKYMAMLKNIEVCPLCLSDIDGEKIQHIIEHYR